MYDRRHVTQDNTDNGTDIRAQKAWSLIGVGLFVIGDILGLVPLGGDELGNALHLGSTPGREFGVLISLQFLNISE
jgi:hypothetical protein